MKTIQCLGCKGSSFVGWVSLTYFECCKDETHSGGVYLTYNFNINPVGDFHELHIHQLQSQR
jgi:hypothetical protein